MDCGAAVLKCLLDGFGISVGYGALKQVCQTQMDGTSPRDVGRVARQYGLAVNHELLPPDHLLALIRNRHPAVVAIHDDEGDHHFVVIWRRLGKFFQVMDPAVGRRWIHEDDFAEMLFRSHRETRAAAWLRWVRGTRFRPLLIRRFRDLGCAASEAEHQVDQAFSSGSVMAVAELDAAVRAVQALVHAGTLSRGREAVAAVIRFRDHVGEIPKDFYAVLPRGDRVKLLGVSCLFFERGAPASAEPAAAEESDDDAPVPELADLMKHPETTPLQELLRLLKADGLLKPSVLAAGILVSALVLVVEAFFFRALLGIGKVLTAEQRFSAMIALLAFIFCSIGLELFLALGMLRMGRNLSGRFRVAVLDKIPKLGDKYLQSLSIPEMAERAHSIYGLRALPSMGFRLVRSIAGLVLTTAGIWWLDHRAGYVAVVAAATAFLLPLMSEPLLAERDLRNRTFSGSLSRFYLDSLLGLVACRTHGAEKAVRVMHEGYLVPWARSGLDLQRIAVWTEGIPAFLGLAFAYGILWTHVARGYEAGGVLLIVYWALRIPQMGDDLAQVVQEYPGHRNRALRIFEPLGAPEEMLFRGETTQQAVQRFTEKPEKVEPVAISIRDLTVRVMGHNILDGINLDIKPGDKVGIVGPSGAGKSSLVGVLLGWNQPEKGAVYVDGNPLDGIALDKLRKETAWVDPSVQLWNRSFLDNLRYGSASDVGTAIGKAVETADLQGILEKLPEGLQTSLGESGGFLSGGEGQRVRFGRGLMRPFARLVILDEPFRGLDREQRHELLLRAKAWWRESTMICITHDVGETATFEKVAVMEHGRIVEFGNPRSLAADHRSRYRALLDAEREVHQDQWENNLWKPVLLQNGKVSELEGRRRSWN